MKKNSTAQSAFFNLRLLAAVLVCVAACLTAASTLRGFFQSEVPARISQRTLTFDERVAYQRAIEEVYWRHRIWPKERPDPKPSLDAVMSQAQLEKKVGDYLRESQALEDYWQHPIRAEQLQAEMDRMAKHTKQPEVLRELFDALGNDSFVIAECLARPVLVERLITSWNANEPRFNDGLTQPGHQTADLTTVPTNSYTLPVTSDGSNCTDDTWSTTAGPPDGRDNHTAIWTGTEMIIWGGGAFGMNTGGRYNPSTDTWIPTSTTNAPSARYSHTAVWTGTEMIVWGGGFPGTNTGGRYNPDSDSWITTNASNAPTARLSHAAVWTGTEMIVWGGWDGLKTFFDTGGRYNPNTDTWTAISSTNAPTARYNLTAAWTGSEMIVWGEPITARCLTQVADITQIRIPGWPRIRLIHLLHDSLTQRCGLERI
jgi:hypothetical protein